jgi:2'-5' RNA ligase
VNDLAEAATRLTANIGKPTRQRFFGHLTLARLKPYAAMPRTLGTMVSAEFDVDEIALVQSRLDPDGARYETLETWPLP